MFQKVKDIFLWVYGLFGTTNKANWKVVALCFFTATTFWFFNALNKSNYTTRLDYPLSFNFNDSSTIIVDKLPEKVTLDVSGGGWNLFRRFLGFDANPLEVDLENPTQTKYIMASALEPEIARQMSDLTLNYVVTDTLSINIEPLESRKLNVYVDTGDIDLRNSYQIVSDITIDPDTVWVTGPRSLVRALTDTARVNIPETNIDEDFDEQMPIVNLGSDLIDLQTAAVNVRFSVVEFVKDTRKATLLKKNFPNDSSAYLAEQEVGILFSYREDRQEAMDSLEFNVLADYARRNRKDSILVPRLIGLPDFVQDVSIVPDTLKVRYVEAK